MSFIAVTYGYNQYSIFNTNVSTLSLIDTIISISFEEMSLLFDSRSKTLNKEVESFNIDLENLNKQIKKLEVDKQKEEEAQKSLGQNSKDKKSPPTNNKQTKNPIQIEVNNTVSFLLEELKNLEKKKQTSQAIFDKVSSKLTLLNESKLKFETIDKKELKIDLVDGHGEKVNIYSKADSYANTYLSDRQCYELHRVFTSTKALI
jgi:hypothetical protein